MTNEPTAEGYNFDILTVKVPVIVGGITYQLDPGELPIHVKIQVEDFVANGHELARKIPAEPIDEEEAIRLTSIALQVDPDITRAWKPLQRWQVLRFLAGNRMPPNMNTSPPKPSE